MILTGPILRVCSCCPTARQRGIWSGQKPVSMVRGVTPIDCGGSSGTGVFTRGCRYGSAGSVLPEAEGVLRKTHRTIADVSADLDAFRFNRAVARIRELTNEVSALAGDEPSKSGRGGRVSKPSFNLSDPSCRIWPKSYGSCWDMRPCSRKRPGQQPRRSTCGRHGDHCRAGKRKLRGTIEMSPSTSKDEAEAMALALENVQRVTEGARPAKSLSCRTR